MTTRDDHLKGGQWRQRIELNLDSSCRLQGPELLGTEKKGQFPPPEQYLELLLLYMFMFTFCENS